MAPTSIHNLPVEIHGSILRHLLSISRIPSFSLTVSRVGFDMLELNTPFLPPPPPIEFEWREKNPRSASLFPFNVISTSKLWFDILAMIPECWTRVVLDVAKDPTPLLEVFSWSENLENIEVLVFNSEDTRIVDKTIECSYVSAIARALYPHIHRCKSIIFDVIYLTSLPPSIKFFAREAPYLEELSLNCCVENLGSLRSQIKHLSKRDLATFPKLKVLSLAGFWFMYLIQHARSSDWFSQISTEHSLSLHISHFTFPRYGRYSLPNFTSYISRTNVKSVHFQDLSLAYAFNDLEPKPESLYDFWGDSHYKSVSKDFLVHLYAITSIGGDGSLSFEACEIPEPMTVQSEKKLKLTNIIDDDKSTSLRNILGVWAGTELTVRSCPSFNDTLLSWLALAQGHPLSTPDEVYLPSDYHPDYFHIDMSSKLFPSKSLSTLNIINCEKFSSRAMREFICLRNDAVLSKDLEQVDEDMFEESAVNNLHVIGRGPILSGGDKGWFRENAGTTAVYWRVRNGREKGEVFKVNGRYR